MYTLLIFGIIAIVIAIRIYYTEKDPFERLGKIIVLLFITTVLYGLTLLVWRISISTFNDEYKPLYIASLTQEQETKLSGSFFLGCGSIDGYTTEFYVTYGRYIKGLKRINLDAYNTYIKHCDTIPPQITNYFKRRVDSAFKSKWCWNRKYSITAWEKNSYDELILIVPFNTVKLEGKFNIDH